MTYSEDFKKSRHELLRDTMMKRQERVIDVARAVGMQTSVMTSAINNDTGNTAIYNLLADYFKLPKRLLIGSALDSIPLNPDPDWKSVYYVVVKAMADTVAPMIDELEHFRSKSDNKMLSELMVKKANKIMEELISMLHICVFQIDDPEMFPEKED